MKIPTTTPNGYRQRNWSTPKNYWIIFILSIHLNWDHYNPKLPPFHFLDSVSPHSLCFKKKKILSLSICTHSRVQFHLHWLTYLYSAPQFPLQSDTCIPLHSSRCNLILVFKSSLHCKTWVLVFLHSFPCGRWLRVFLLHHLSSLTSIFGHRENNIYQTKKKITSFPFWQSTWPEKSYQHLLPHPPFHSPFPVF